MYLLSNIFQCFPNFFAKLSDFCVIGCVNWRATNVYWASEVKEWHSKVKERPRKHTGRGWVIVCFNVFWRKNYRPLSSSSSISSSVLSDLKPDGCVPVRALQKFLVFQRQRCQQSKLLSIKILICLKSPITKHLVSCPFLYQIERLLWHWKR
jgi:hypothetical protein